MNWQSFPFKDHPRKTIFLMVFLVLFAIGIYFSFGLYWMIVSMIFFCTSISAYFLPTKYTMDDNGVTIKGIVAVRAKKWSEFGSCYKDKNGILLSPFDKPTRLDSYRGTYIRFNKNAEEVTKFVKSKIESNSRSDIPV
ncbi:MAG: hypothetical protein WC614_04760 [bacterium]